jgi:hypothetical protein
MKTEIKSWLAERTRIIRLTGLARLCGGLANAVTLETTPFVPARQLVPIQVRREVQFTPRINFRRPRLDPLTDFAGIERALRGNLRRPF